MIEAHDIKGLDPMTSYLQFTALKPVKLTDHPKYFGHCDLQGKYKSRHSQAHKPE